MNNRQMIKLIANNYKRWLWEESFNPPPYDPFYSEFRAFTHYCHLHGPSLAQQINCNKILFSHTGIWLLVSFSLYFFIFCFFLLFYVILLFVNFYKHYFIRIGNSLICGDIWHKHHEWYFKIVIRNFHEPLGEWNMRWSITSGICAKYHVQIMLLFVYTTTRERFVIFTYRHFKLSWNTTALLL